MNSERGECYLIDKVCLKQVIYIHSNLAQILTMEQYPSLYPIFTLYFKLEGNNNVDFLSKILNVQ